MIDKWTSSLGAGARVVVLDSGLLADDGIHPEAVKNFTHRPMEHFARHGTDMAAIIASRDPMNLGVAPYCKLYIGKVVTGEVANWRHYEQSLEWAIEMKADVVSMSFASPWISRGFSDLITELDNRRAICCAAYHPHSWSHTDPHVITVGHAGPMAAARAITVGEILRRTANGGFRAVRGTSVSTAIVAGMAACAKTQDPSLDRLGFLAALAAFNISDPVGSSSGAPRGR